MKTRTLAYSTIAALFVASAALAPAAGFAQPRELATLPSLAPLVDSVKSSVVNVDVQKRASAEQTEFFERFGQGRRRGDEAPLNAGTGSGFLIDPKGLVITNNHVVENAVIIRVRLDDGRAYDGEVVGRDPLTDIALVKLKGKFDPLPFVKLGDSSTLRPGDWVVAIGNPFGLAQSVSAGIISALDRQIGATRYDQFLQTDAAINPGNSGGPLFNLKGEVIGMNTAIIGAATGIGFAVPSSLIRAIIPQLEKAGVVTRGWLGVAIQDVSAPLAKALKVPGGEGALVFDVTENSPASKAGVKEEDVVTAIDGEKVSSATALTRAVALKRPDSTVTLAIFRDGKQVEAKVKLGVRPDLEKVGELDRKPSEATEAHRKLGIAFQDVDPRMAEAAGVPRQGALIVEVSPGSAAETAGLRRGMVVVEVNRKAVRNQADLLAALKDLKAGSVALLRVATAGASGRALIAVEVP
jgi:serine protease Do